MHINSVSFILLIFIGYFFVRVGLLLVHFTILLRLTIFFIRKNILFCSFILHTFISKLVAIKYSYDFYLPAGNRKMLSSLNYLAFLFLISFIFPRCFLYPFISLCLEYQWVLLLAISQCTNNFTIIQLLEAK